MAVTAYSLSRDDENDFLAAVAASRALHRPWIDPPDTHERFAAYCDHTDREDQAAFVIRHDDCGALVGFVNVGNIVLRAFQSAYLGYGAFAGHAGRGLMTAGVRVVVGIAFGRLGLHRVEANIQPANTASIALVKRLGFEREGFSRRYLMVAGDWRDHERWALLADTRRLPPCAPGWTSSSISSWPSAAWPKA